MSPTRKAKTARSLKPAREKQEAKVPGFAARLDVVVGASKSAFAARIGVATSLVSGWTNGQGLPTSPKLWQISKETGVSIDWLLFGPGLDPIYRSQSRSDATLEADLAARVIQEVLTEQRVPDEWRRTIIAERIDGEQLLSRLVDLAAEDVGKLAAFLERWAEVGAELRRVYGPALVGAPRTMFDAMGGQMTGNGLVTAGPETYQKLAARILENEQSQQEQQKPKRTTRTPRRQR